MVELTNSAAKNNGKFEWINPGVSLLSKQLDPFTLQAGLSASGELSFGVTRDITEDNRLGYQINLSLQGADSFSVSPTLNYKVTPKIHASLSTQISSNLEVRSTIGV